MLRDIKKMTAIVLTVCIFNPYIGCTFINDRQHKSDSKKIEIGVILFDQNDPFILSLGKQIENIAREKEDSSEYKININSYLNVNLELINIIHTGNSSVVKSN